MDREKADERMNTWPQSREQLESCNWIFERRTRCAGGQCKKTIEWWRSSAGRWIPLEAMFQSDPNMLVMHHAFCPNVNQFRGKPVEEKPAKETKPVEQKPKKVESGRLF